MATAATIAAAAAAAGHGEPEAALALRRDAALRRGGRDRRGWPRRRRPAAGPCAGSCCGGALGGLPLGAADGLELVDVHRLRCAACCWAACWAAWCAAARWAASYAARWSAGAAGCGGVNGLVGCAGAAGSGCVCWTGSGWVALNGRKRLGRVRSGGAGRQRAVVRAVLRGGGHQWCPPWSRYHHTERALEGAFAEPGNSLRVSDGSGQAGSAASTAAATSPASRSPRARRPRRSTRTSTTLRPGPGRRERGQQPVDVADARVPDPVARAEGGEVGAVRRAEDPLEHVRPVGLPRFERREDRAAVVVGDDQLQVHRAASSGPRSRPPTSCRNVRSPEQRADAAVRQPERDADGRGDGAVDAREPAVGQDHRRGVPAGHQVEVAHGVRGADDERVVGAGDLGDHPRERRTGHPGPAARPAARVEPVEHLVDRGAGRGVRGPYLRTFLVIGPVPT